MARVKHISIAVIATVALVGVLAAPASGTSGGRFSVDGSITAAGVPNPPSDAAAAKPGETPKIVFRSHPVKSPASATPLVLTVETGDSSGFDWGAASIGAGTIVGLGALLSGAVLFRRRRQRPVAHGAV